MNQKFVEQVFDDYKLIAIIIFKEYQKEGIEFFTPHNLSQQLAYMKREKGYKIPEHLHKLVPRNVKYTLETLFIKSGKVKINFYNENKEYLDNRILKTGDIILLVSGGHGFEMLEDTEIIEVKQGPHAGEEDKQRF